MNHRLGGVNNELLSDLYDLLEYLEDYSILKEPEMLDNLQKNLSTIRIKYTGISQQEDLLVTEYFFLPFNELLHSIDLEINELNNTLKAVF